MRFGGSTHTQKPPASRGNSRKASRARAKRPDSTNRLLREDKNNYSRGTRGMSLHRTQGKKQSRLIFSGNSEPSKPTVQKKTAPSYPSTQYIKTDYKSSITKSNVSKPNIHSYTGSSINNINRPYGTTTTTTSSNYVDKIAGLSSTNNTSSSSNFPNKIAIPRGDIKVDSSSSYLESLKRNNSTTYSGGKENEQNSKLDYTLGYEYIQRNYVIMF